MKKTQKQIDLLGFLLQRETDKWLQENPRLLDDAIDLANKCVSMKMMWGMPITIIFDDEAFEQQKRNIGRGLGIIKKYENKS